MTAERNYWSAVSSLREAETLASLAGSVSGPADEPPSPGGESSWLEDWSRRAGETLEKARMFAQSKKRAMKDRAKRILARIRDGAAAARRAVGAPIAKANVAYQQLLEAMNTANYAFLGAEVLVAAAAAFVLWKLFVK